MKTPATLSPVPLLGEAEEKRKLKQLEAAAPNLVLVVSDLHLGKGLEQVTDRFYRRENFFADNAFRRFLQHQLRQASGTKLLVLNGDVLDFLRIDDWPKDSQQTNRWISDLERLGVQHTDTNVSNHEQHFGLHTDPAKSVYKFKIIARGHPEFFKALALWLQADGTILYVKGNHDVEQHWPLIRQAFRDEVLLASAPFQSVIDRIVFAEDNATLANVYIEHGHNYEFLTRVPKDDAELLKGKLRLSLPLGSFFNRYIINKMEREEPFLDNIKPVTDALRTMVRRNPLAVLEILERGTAFLWNALRGRRGGHVLLALVTLTAAIVYVLPVAIVGTIIAYFASADVRHLITGLPLLSSPVVRVAGSIVGLVAPFLAALLRAGWRWLHRPNPFEDEFAAGVYKRLQSGGNGRLAGWNMRYAVLGHTHQQDMQLLPPPGVVGPSLLYLNSGTWTPLWPQDRPDLIGRVYYSFLRFQRANGEYHHESLVWDDEMDSSRPAQVLGPA